MGTNGRRKSCGTCRCSRRVRPAVSSYLENLNYATVIKASSSVLARGPEDEEEWKSSGANERPRRREDVLRDSTWRKGILAEESAALFRETRRTALFFLSSLSLSLPPCLSFSLSLSCCFFSTVSNPDVRRYKLMKCPERKRSAVPLKITSAACRNNRRDELLRLPYSSQTRFTLRLKCSTMRIPRWQLFSRELHNCRARGLETYMKVYGQ